MFDKTFFGQKIWMEKSCVKEYIHKRSVSPLKSAKNFSQFRNWLPEY